MKKESVRKKGIFIAFEGIDGSGLTTQANLLKSWFLERDLRVHLTKEPSYGPIGTIIRMVLEGRLKDLSSETVALLFAADRLDHLHCEIEPHLDAGFCVITDRYLFSTLAYQSLNLELSWLKEINFKARIPDLTIFLDVPVKTCLLRMKKSRHFKELFESKEKLKRIRSNYLKILDDLREDSVLIERIDGLREIEKIHREILSKVKKLL
ncbi:MAG: dTMP kinase [Candidatus Methanofastidiosia archaeon]